MAFHALRREAAPGVDGVTCADDEANLEPRLATCSDGSIGSLPATAVRPGLHSEGGWTATAMVLNAIHEEDFLGFSYGFRPPRLRRAGSRGQHDALDALVVGSPAPR